MPDTQTPTKPVPGKKYLRVRDDQTGKIYRIGYDDKPPSDEDITAALYGYNHNQDEVPAGMGGVRMADSRDNKAELQARSDQYDVNAKEAGYPDASAQIKAYLKKKKVLDPLYAQMKPSEIADPRERAYRRQQISNKTAVNIPFIGKVATRPQFIDTTEEEVKAATKEYYDSATQYNPETGSRNAFIYPTIGGIMSGHEVPPLVGAAEHLTMMLAPGLGAVGGGVARGAVAKTALGAIAKQAGIKGALARAGVTAAGIGGNVAGAIGGSAIEQPINAALQGPELTQRIEQGKAAFRKANPAGSAYLESLPFLGLGTGISSDPGQLLGGAAMGAGTEGVRQLQEGRFDAPALVTGALTGLPGTKGGHISEGLHSAGEAITDIPGAVKSSQRAYHSVDTGALPDPLAVGTTRYTAQGKPIKIVGHVEVAPSVGRDANNKPIVAKGAAKEKMIRISGQVEPVSPAKLLATTTADIGPSTRIVRNKADLTKAFTQDWGLPADQAALVADRWHAYLSSEAKRTGAPLSEVYKRISPGIGRGGDVMARQEARAQGQSDEQIAQNLLSDDPEVMSGVAAKASPDVNQRIAYALNAPDTATAFHELGHIMREHLSPEELATVGKHSGATQSEDGTWVFDQNAEENFANAVEAAGVKGARRSLSNAALDANLPPAFSKIAKGFGAIADRIQGTKGVNPEVAKIIEQRFGYKGETPSEPLRRTAPGYTIKTPTTPTLPTQPLQQPRIGTDLSGASTPLPGRNQAPRLPISPPAVRPRNRGAVVDRIVADAQAAAAQRPLVPTTGQPSGGPDLAGEIGPDFANQIGQPSVDPATAQRFSGLDLGAPTISQTPENGNLGAASRGETPGAPPVPKQANLPKTAQPMKAATPPPAPKPKPVKPTKVQRTGPQEFVEDYLAWHEGGQVGAEPDGAAYGLAKRSVDVLKASAVSTDAAVAMQQGTHSPNVSSGGKQTTVHTPTTNRPISVRYHVVEADALTPSHTDNFAPHPNYEPSLQPRDRTRTATKAQVADIATRLEPSRLGASPTTADGAPIVGKDLQVESGNGRTLAIRKAYSDHFAAAAAYRAHLEANAAEYGIDPASIRSMKKPVLVRVREGEVAGVDRATLAAEMGESPVASMSATETAQGDAKKLTASGILSKFVPNDAGRIDTTANSDFKRAFLSMLPEAERGALMRPDGSLSAEGERRMKGAILASAYGDPHLIGRILEGGDTANLAQALLRSAPKIASMREGIARGHLHDLDISADVAAAAKRYAQDVASAANRYADLSKKGGDVSENIKSDLAQTGMYDDGLSPVARELLAFFGENKNRPAKMAEYLNTYADVVAASGDPKQVNMFGEELPTVDSALTAAREIVERDAGTGTGTKTESETRPANDKGVSAGEANKSEKPADLTEIRHHFQSQGWRYASHGPNSLEMTNGKEKINLFVDPDTKEITIQTIHGTKTTLPSVVVNGAGRVRTTPSATGRMGAGQSAESIYKIATSQLEAGRNALETGTAPPFGREVKIFGEWSSLSDPQFKIRKTKTVGKEGTMYADEGDIGLLKRFLPGKWRGAPLPGAHVSAEIKRIEQAITQGDISGEDVSRAKSLVAKLSKLSDSGARDVSIIDASGSAEQTKAARQGAHIVNTTRDMITPAVVDYAKKTTHFTEATKGLPDSMPDQAKVANVIAGVVSGNPDFASEAHRMLAIHAMFKGSQEHGPAFTEAVRKASTQEFSDIAEGMQDAETSSRQTNKDKPGAQRVDSGVLDTGETPEVSGNVAGDHAGDTVGAEPAGNDGRTGAGNNAKSLPDVSARGRERIQKLITDFGTVEWGKLPSKMRSALSAYAQAQKPFAAENKTGVPEADVVRELAKRGIAPPGKNDGTVKGSTLGAWVENTKADKFAPDRIFWAESPYEVARAHSLNNDANVASFGRAESFRVSDPKTGQSYTYTPDFKITYKDGRSVYEEVKPREFVEKREDVLARVNAAKTYLRGKGDNSEVRFVTQAELAKDKFGAAAAAPETYQYMRPEQAKQMKARLTDHGRRGEKQQERVRERSLDYLYQTRRRKYAVSPTNPVSTGAKVPPARSAAFVSSAKTAGAAATRTISTRERVLRAAIKTASVPREVMATGDISAGGRQGAILAAAEPGIAAKHLAVTQFKAFRKQNYDDFTQALKTRKFAGLDPRKAGLYFGTQQNHHAALATKEEAFVSDFLSRFPVLGNIRDASERSYTMYLDALRADVYDKWAGELVSRGKDPIKNAKDFQDIAQFINIATGRGDNRGPAGAFLDRHAASLAVGLFAPRYAYSRFQFMNPATYAHMTPQARRIALRSAARFVGVVGAFMGTLAANGWKVELNNMDDPDFLKARKGKFVIDPGAGTIQGVRALMRVIKGSVNRVRGVKNARADEPEYVASRFLRSKLSPVGSLEEDYRTGHDYIGNPFSWGEAIKSRSLPMGWKDIWDAGAEDGPGAALMMTPNLAGVTIGRYEKRGSSSVSNTVQSQK